MSRLPLLLLCLSAGAASAQDAAYVGQWACQSAYEEYDQAGNRTSGHNRQYFLAIYLNQTFEAQGQVLSAAGVNQFQSQGQWVTDQGRLMAQGPEMSDGLNVPGMMFVHPGILQGQNVMAFTLQTPASNGQGITSRSDVYCERQG